ncbi:MAG: type I 3-dehydroquinate dehydratase [Bacteroidales bacterium]|nr:type I 3-dehydroquinate dehydratase [Bacteroidales bacterium]
MFYVSLSAEGIENAEKQLGGEKFAELRLDLVKPSIEEMEALLKRRSDVKFIVTCRDGFVDKETKFEYLRRAALAGAEYLDLELELGEKFICSFQKGLPVKIIVSYHNYDKTPEYNELYQIVKQCVACNCDIAKIVCTVNNLNDTGSLLGLYSSYIHNKNIVAFGMGEKASFTRVVCLKCGAPFTYASPDDGSATAPGQLIVSKMKAMYKALE